jgi:trigger factor
MDVRIEEVSPVEKKLVVQVPWETVRSKLEAAYRDLSRGVQLRGFRKGKVPQSVLERMFGKRVRAEVAVQLVRESFLTATSEHNLEAVSEPKVEEADLSIQKGEPFSFEAVVEVKGTVEAKDYDGMELFRRPLAVADEAVDKAVEALQAENTELLPIEGRDVTARTDVLYISLKGTIGDREVERDGMPVDLTDDANEPLPGLVAALVGLPISAADHSFELAIPNDVPDEGVAGQTAKLTVTIKDARRKQVPELDDDFAKDVGRGETVEELRASVRKELEAQQEEEIKRELREAARKELVKRNQIPVASALVDRAVEYQFSRLKMMLGIPAGQDGGLTDDLAEKMRPSAADEVRGQLLLEAVAEAEGVEVSEGELDEHVSSVARTRGVQPARLRAEYDRDGRLENIMFSLRQDKTLDLLISRATVTEKEPEPEPEPGDEPASEVDSGDAGEGESDVDHARATAQDPPE